MAGLNLQGRLEVMKQVTEVVKSAAVAPTLQWKASSLVELTDVLFKKMVELVEGDKKSED